MWKLLVCVLKFQKLPYIRAINIKDETYILRIEKYETVEDLIKKAASYGILTAQSTKAENV